MNLITSKNNFLTLNHFNKFKYEFNEMFRLNKSNQTSVETPLKIQEFFYPSIHPH